MTGRDFYLEGLALGREGKHDEALNFFARKAGGQMARVEVRPRVSQEEPMALQSVEVGAEHISRMTEDAAEYTILKGRQIIDQQGDRIFQ